LVADYWNDILNAMDEVSKDEGTQDYFIGTIVLRAYFTTRVDVT